MTTFDFSIHPVPAGHDWPRRFLDWPRPKSLLHSLDEYGATGWGGFGAFVQWTEEEDLAHQTPDCCTHVAECSREQLLRFAAVCMRERLCGEDAYRAFVESIHGLPGSAFVICVIEF